MRLCMLGLKWLMLRYYPLLNFNVSMHLKSFLGACALILSTTGASLAQPIPVEIVETPSGFVLHRDGQPYVVHGAGMMVDDLDRFVARGGNSIRTWTTRSDEFDIDGLLDRAHELGVTVALTLPMVPERHGFDYNDEVAVQKQLDELTQDVLRHKDHPALLVWIIGNELNHSYGNPRVWDAVNDVAEMIAKVDPNHPSTTALAGVYGEVIDEINARAPALDFLSFQVYGTLFGLKDKLAQLAFDRPFMVTEWGTIGWWEMETTHWGAPVELTSSEKAQVFLKGHEEVLSQLQSQLIGDYAFFWGQKQERTPTWFGLVTAEGELTEAVDVMTYKWTGQWPISQAPRVEAFTLAEKTARQSPIVLAGQTYPAEIKIQAEEGEGLSYHWSVLPESTAQAVGGDYEAPIAPVAGAIVQSTGASATIKLTERGAYRLFVRVTDSSGQAAHANIPFFVEDGFVQSSEALLQGEVMAVAYSGFRAGQHPDRGEGAVNPSREEILEDLNLLVEHGFRLIRVYDAGENTQTILELIRAHGLPLEVLLGMWISAEISNHEGCPWLEAPIPDEQLALNRQENEREVQRGIELANAFNDIVVAVNVGNEALVDWTDHMVELDRMIELVTTVKEAIAQPVTVAENYEWWIQKGAPLAAVVDFIGVHTYPVWEGRSIEEGLSYTIENLMAVRRAIPEVPMAVLEAGWATTASEFGERANEAAQRRYFDELAQWGNLANVTMFFFSAFDEPWKGDPADPVGAEKHWGVFFEDRTPKKVLQQFQ